MIKFLPLEKVCSIIVDCPHESPEWLSAGIPVIRNFNLVDGQLNTDDLYFVDKETYEHRTRRAVPQKGDIIFSREAPIGNCAIVPDNFQCCLGQRLVLLRVNPEICNSDYLLAALLSKYVEKQVAQVSKTGSTVSNFAISDLKKLEIPIAENQEYVSNCFSILNGEIIKNKEQLSTLKKIVKLIYDYWFVQFDFPDQNGKPYKASGGQMMWNDELKHKIPQGWLVNTINTILVEREKSSIQVGEAAGHKGAIPFFTSGDEIIMHDTAIIDGKNCFLNTGGNADIKYYIGPASYSTDTWCISAGIYTSYLYEYLDSIKKYLNMSFFAGSGLRHLQKEAFKGHKIIIPPDKLIQKFNEIADQCYHKISHLTLENQSLSDLRDFLLPMLMNGQVKITTTQDK